MELVVRHPHDRHLFTDGKAVLTRPSSLTIIRMLVRLLVPTIWPTASFPVVNLARSQPHWLKDPFRGDFVSDSMSVEAVAAVVLKGIHLVEIRLSFPSGGSIDPLDWPRSSLVAQKFLDRFDSDLLALGLDPAIWSTAKTTFRLFRLEPHSSGRENQRQREIPRTPPRNSTASHAKRSTGKLQPSAYVTYC